MAFLTIRSFIQASLIEETERGVSRMLVSSPITSLIGRTVGRTCSSSGTSLTVIFASVVTGPVASVDVVVVVVAVVAEVVVVWARPGAGTAAKEEQPARPSGPGGGGVGFALAFG